MFCAGARRELVRRGATPPQSRTSALACRIAWHRASAAAAFGESSGVGGGGGLGWEDGQGVAWKLIGPLPRKSGRHPPGMRPIRVN